MDLSLKEESEKLARSWMQHDATMLRDYLVAGVEDPRINLQSIFSRHFIIRALTGRFSLLMEQEYRFAAVMNWLAGTVRQVGHADDLEAILHALKCGSDNAEGIAIPQFVCQTFAALPATTGYLMVPNYVESFLVGAQRGKDGRELHQPSLDTFLNIWSQALAAENSRHERREETMSPALQRVSVLEPACGSANDYRFLEACGIARLVEYSGFDLCAKNVENARRLFPNGRFETGNVFEIAAADKSFDLVFMHDLLEHFSFEGLAAAVQEICRVAKWGICIGFFNLDEIPEHILHPIDEYHWNTLSMARMKELFARHGFDGQVIHAGSFLRLQIGCDYTHNPNAYTFILDARRNPA